MFFFPEELVVEAGCSKTACVLWNSSKVTSTDSGASQIRKRRQKLTDDLLRAVVVCHGDALSLVSWWFRTFEFYAERPEDVSLPTLPERREKEVNAAEELLCRTPSRRAASNGATPMSAASRNAWSKNTRLQRPASASAVPKLRPRPGPPKVTKAVADDLACELRRRELLKDRVTLKSHGLAGPGTGDLDLTRRLRLEHIDAEILQDWSGVFEDEKAFQRRRPSLRWKPSRGSISVFTAPFTRQASWREEQKGESKDVASRLFAKFRVMADLPDQRDGSSSATSDDESATQEFTDVCEVTTREVMLRCSSLALLNSKLMKKVNVGKQEKAMHSYEEVLADRARILRSVKPVEMTMSDFVKILGCFGVERRRTIERMASALLLSVPRLGRVRKGTRGTTAAPSDDLNVEASRSEPVHVPFEVLYHFMRDIAGGPPTTAERSHSQLLQAWCESDHLRRMLFAVLTGEPGISYDAGAADKRAWGCSAVSLTLHSLTESIRWLLCGDVLYEVEKTVREANVSTTSSEGTAPEIPALAEFLLSHLYQAQASRDGGQTAKESVSFFAFEQFVAKFPEVYTGLLSLLLPLAGRGANFVSQEMDLVARQLTHRAGELRAKISVQMQLRQRSYLEKLYTSFVQPWLQTHVRPLQLSRMSFFNV